MTLSSNSANLTIAIVGPCASGKSSLAAGLNEYGIRARQVVQEHSYVPEMWHVITKPDLLIYLEASFQACSKRKPLNWQQPDYDEQLRRLAHARENCDILIETDELTEAAVLNQVVSELRARDIISI